MSEHREKGHGATDLTREVEAILKAISADGSVRAELSLDALAYVTALIMDLDPSVTVRSHMRKYVEEQAGATLTYLRVFRDHYEKTGVHFLEQIGGTVEVGTGTVAGMTKQ
jgi:hypothetical protein